MATSNPTYAVVNKARAPSPQNEIEATYSVVKKPPKKSTNQMSCDEINPSKDTKSLSHDATNHSNDATISSRDATNSPNDAPNSSHDATYVNAGQHTERRNTRRQMGDYDYFEDCSKFRRPDIPSKSDINSKPETPSKHEIPSKPEILSKPDILMQVEPHGEMTDNEIDEGGEVQAHSDVAHNDGYEVGDELNENLQFDGRRSLVENVIYEGSDYLQADTSAAREQNRGENDIVENSLYEGGDGLNDNVGQVTTIANQGLDTEEIQFEENEIYNAN